MTVKGGTGPRGEASAGWKGGRVVAQKGYIGIYMPQHHRAGPAGYVFEHILVAERALRRRLAPKHPVHHVDENPANNAGGNLVICEDNAYHKLIHQRMRAFAACGDPSARRCVRCKGYGEQNDIRVSGDSAYHLSCNRAHVAAAKLKKSLTQATSAMVGA